MPVKIPRDVYPITFEYWLIEFSIEFHLFVLQPILIPMTVEKIAGSGNIVIYVRSKLMLYIAVYIFLYLFT